MKYDFGQLLEITNWSNQAALHARDRHLRWNHIPLGTLAWALQSRNMILNIYYNIYELIKSSGTARERPTPQAESVLLRDSSVGTPIQREKCSVFS